MMNIPILEHCIRNVKEQVILTNRFTIFLPEIFGFCGGVISALKKLEKTISETVPPSKVFLLGEIIHNPTVNQYFKTKGVELVEYPPINEIFTKANGDIDKIVIPAFGLPIHLEDKIRSNFKFVIDTTCSNVKSVWSFVNLNAKGSTFLLFGKQNHPEVEAIISRAINSCVIILPSVETCMAFTKIIPYLKSNNDEFIRRLQQIKAVSVKDIQFLNRTRFCFASQTTMLYEDALKIIDIFDKTFKENGVDFVPNMTICKATSERQNAALKICAKNLDLIIVIGGYNSSNTNHLYWLASKYGKPIYISEPNSIAENKTKIYDPQNKTVSECVTEDIFKGVKTIGILAGASCPFYIVDTVVNKLRTL